MRRRARPGQWQRRGGASCHRRSWPPRVADPASKDPANDRCEHDRVLRTWLTEQFDIAVPVVLAPMAGVSGGRLAAAVSAAGGLGMVGIGYEEPAQIAAEAEVARAGGRPFGIGLIAWYAENHPALVTAASDARPALLSLSFGAYAHHVAAARDAGIVVAVQA